MKVILTKDVKGLGKTRDLVEVKSGYFQNFLAKNSLAVEASEENMVSLEKALEDERKAAAELKKEAEKTKELIDGKTVTLSLKSGEGGRLYGAVTSKDVSEAIKDQLGLAVDKRKVESGSIKETGSYDVAVKLHSDVEAKIKVLIEERAK